MGCCTSTTLEVEVYLEDLRRQVEELSSMKAQEKLILHYITLLEEAECGSRERALYVLATVIRLVETAQ